MSVTIRSRAPARRRNVRPTMDEQAPAVFPACSVLYNGKRSPDEVSSCLYVSYVYGVRVVRVVIGGEGGLLSSGSFIYYKHPSFAPPRASSNM